MSEFKVPLLPVKSEKLEEIKSNKEVVNETTPKKEPEKSAAAAASACPYKIPKWSGLPNPEVPYKFEVFKSGTLLEDIKDLEKQAVWKFGRLPENDIEMAHPTISRFHAILQYRPAKVPIPSEGEEENEDKSDVPEGWYIYDLGSTHGTYLNKQKIPPRVYIRIKVGHILKLGASTRWYLLQGPQEDEEPESELSVTELKEKRQRDIEEAAELARLKALEAEEREKNEGVSWGMGEDADEETDVAHNPFAATNNEELFLDDPKKTLRGYFEREGLQLEYKCDELSAGSYICRVELPLDDQNGRPIVAEAVHKGRKKECVVQCALEACRILDRHGVLRQTHQEPQKRKIKKDSDDDDDDFWDRTGDIERKKQKKANPSNNAPLTYEDLLQKAVELDKEMEKNEELMLAYQEQKRQSKKLEAKTGNNEEDDLDSFMENLNEGSKEMDRTEIRKLHLENQRLKAERQRVERLIEIARPTELPSLYGTPAAKETTQNKAKKQFAMIGKRNQFSKFKIVKPVEPKRPTTQAKQLASDEEEMDDDDDDDDKTEAKKTKSSSVTESPQETKSPEGENSSENANNVEATVGEEKLKKDSEENEEKQSAAKDSEETDQKEDIVETQTSSKKRKNRQRVRHVHREEMDYNELNDHEAEDKYAKWVPPADQTGDGFTSLNDKYGY